MDYEVTDSGAAFIENALRICNRFQVTWADLWGEDDGNPTAAAARLALGFLGKAAETGQLLGAVAVIQVLREVSLGHYELQEGVGLLKTAQLLSEKNIAVAAETFGISEAQVWDLVST